MKKVAIIGANGFLGSNLLRYGFKNNQVIFYPVINSNSNNISSDIKTYSFNEFLKIPNEALDCIVFAPGSFRDSKSKLIEINFTLLLKIKAVFQNVRLIYISSTNIYGNHKSDIELETKPNIESDYAKAKLGGEFIASSFNSFSIIRFTYLYGQNLNNGSFIPFIIKEALNKRKITLFNEGTRFQDYLFIEDAVDLCYKAIKSEINATVLGVSLEKISNNYVAELIKNNVENCKLEYVNKDEKVINFSFKVNDNPYKWKAKTTFKEGMLKVLNSYKI